MSAHAESPPSLVPEPKGFEYAVGDLIGRGGFAICHRAERLDKKKPTGHVVALKIVKAEMEPAKLAQKFITELQIHSKMQHPNIVEFYRAFTFERSTYVVLELCGNGSLADMLKKRKFLSMPEIRRFVIQICGAIKYLHHRNVVHRDLKTGNIFLDSNMNVKLGDFGLAAVLATNGDIVKRRTTMCGTPNYLAPEILEKGLGHNEKVDLWAVGVIAYTLAVGKAPFHASTKEEIYKRLKSRDYNWPELDNHRNDISSDLRDLVATVLVEESERPSPDAIVSHDFFKIAFVPDLLTPACITRPPKWPQNRPPTQETLQRGYSETWFALCSQSGVGEYELGKSFALNGGKKIRNIVKECEREVVANRQPVVPIPSDMIYVPFPDRYNWLARSKDLSEIPEEKEPSMDEGRYLKEISPNAAAREKRPRETLKSRAELMKPVPSMPPPPTIWIDAEPELAQPTKGTQRKMLAQPRRPVSRKPTDDEAYPTPRTRVQSETRRPVRTGSVRVAGPVQTLARRPRMTRTASKAAEGQVTPPTPIEIHEDTSPQGQTTARKTDKLELRPQPRPDSVVQSSSESKSLQHEPQTTGTDPAAVLSRLATFRDNLTNALKSTSTTSKASVVSQKVRAPAEDISQNLPFVTKWVDYSRKHGVGYVLESGVIGCIMNGSVTKGPGSGSSKSSTSSLPVSHILVRSGQHHLSELPNSRDTANMGAKEMQERLQRIPFEFYEDMSTTDKDATDGLLHSDLTRERRREYGLLWGKFGRYMVSSLGTSDTHSFPSTSNAGLAPPSTTSTAPTTSTTPTPSTDNSDASTKEPHPSLSSPPSKDFVRFYQRHGNVGTWAFASGALQFNFPDHTKLVLSPLGTSVSLTHLTAVAARHLRAQRELPQKYIRQRATLACSTEALLRGTSIGGDGELRRFGEVVRANAVREKLELVRGVVEGWIEGGGLGRIGEGKDAREVFWDGQMAEDSGKKLEWVTVGRFGGDEGKKEDR
ncbi:Pkinase-domain-containing protein [Viridothelium virens]|uniref:Pkinase-domain-containing protein n=1 Tax=Viridothelium virens TaxID=1048519 RepID=A0A6A6GSI9_VIRVR|nr:Pkinase-domain-containing protein [Viridothelium virens]